MIQFRMATSNKILWGLYAAALCAAAPAPAFGHGFAGQRFFPATLATDDPFVADELSLPTVSSRRIPATGAEPAGRESTASVEIAKRMTPRLGLGVGVTGLQTKPDGESAQRGFDNLALSAKYQFYENDDREAIASAGVDWDVGGTGAKRVGVESFSTVTPAVFFGKGFGDLPENFSGLRPFAVTGSLGVAMPSNSSAPDVLTSGLSLQYSIPYLQSAVKDIGLRAPFNRMIPIIEIAMEKPMDRGGGPTTGTVNPGVLWAGKSVQFGLEAIVPINSRSGSGVGFIAQLHFYLDDLFPQTLGKPIYGQ